METATTETQERDVFLLQSIGWRVEDSWHSYLLYAPEQIHGDAYFSLEQAWSNAPDLSSREAACYREDLLLYLLSLGWAIDDISQNAEQARFEMDMRCWDGYGEDAILRGKVSGRGETYQEAFLQAAYEALKALSVEQIAAGDDKEERETKATP